MSDVHPRLGEKYLVDPYDNWAKAQGVPIVTAPAIDLTQVQTAPWARFGVPGAICHVEGRCDFLTLFVLDIPVGGATKPMRHTYEEIFYVVDGRGETEVRLSDGEIRKLAWAPGAMFAVPVNATYIHRAPGTSAVRLAAFNDMRYLMGLYRNEAFLFDNPAPFQKRQEKARARALGRRSGERTGDRIQRGRAGRHRHRRQHDRAAGHGTACGRERSREPADAGPAPSVRRGRRLHAFLRQRRRPGDCARHGSAAS